MYLTYVANIKTRLHLFYEDCCLLIVIKYTKQQEKSMRFYK